VKRVVQPELLDALPPDDPRAIRSRGDLCRVNAWMGNHKILSRALRETANGTAPGRIVELGAGDGQFLLRVAQSLAPSWPRVSVTLLDRLETVRASTLSAFTTLGWRAEASVADALDWAATTTRPAEIVVANLFLHHFSEAQLARLFTGVARWARLFVAVEPRRGAWPLFCTRWLWAIGCNNVTCHDAKASARAGFMGAELSSLWPANAEWKLCEEAAGFFSHLFVAHRSA